MGQVSRRRFLFTVGASAAGSILLHGCLGNPPDSTSSSGKSSSAALPVANVNSADAPETTNVRLGFVGQTDASPLIIAKVKGFFARHGLPDLKLVKQPSWGVTRDNLELGSGGGGIDGGMILSAIPHLMSLGLVTKGNKKIPMYVPLRLNSDGQGITVADRLKDTGVKLDTSVLAAKAREAKAAGKILKFAHTFKGGTSDIMLRYWLAAGGIDPDNDVSILQVPGPQLVANMKTGDLDGFCVGEPWHLRAINQKLGYTAMITGEFWENHPEKSLTFRADWMDKNPKTAKAILKAVMEAQQWCDKKENRQEMAEILSKDEWAKVPVTDIIDRLKGKVDYGDGRPVVDNSPYVMHFWDKNASYPYKSHDLWFLNEDVRWGTIPADTDLKKVVDAVNREDVWREAAKEIGVTVAEIPQTSSRGIEKFFDGVAFNPDDPVAYLKSLKVKKVSV
jgi:nitrate/nitrite transport system substrate-binding protein